MNSIRQRRLQHIGIACTILCALAIFCLSSIPSQSFPSAKVGWSYLIHFVEYACFGVCLVFALASPGESFWRVLVLALIIASLYGASDEFHQVFTPGRSPDWRDWLTDTCGSALGASVTAIVLRMKGWFVRTR